MIYLLHTRLPSNHQCIYPNWRNLEPQLQVVTHPMTCFTRFGPNSSKFKKTFTHSAFWSEIITRVSKNLGISILLHASFHCTYKVCIYMDILSLVFSLNVFRLMSPGRHLVAFYYKYTCSCPTKKAGQISSSIQVNPYHIRSSMQNLHFGVEVSSSVLVFELP